MSQQDGHICPCPPLGGVPEPVFGLLLQQAESVITATDLLAPPVNAFAGFISLQSLTHKKDHKSRPFYSALLFETARITYDWRWRELVYAF